MRDVRKYTPDEVPTGRVATQVDVARFVAGFFVLLEHVANRFDGLPQLRGILPVRSEAVCQSKNCDRLSRSLHVLYDAGEELEVTLACRERETAACV